MVFRPGTIEESKLEGFKYFQLLEQFLPRLRDVGAERDKSGNRELFCDQYLGLLLFYFFNPTITSLNALQEATGLEKVQKLLGIKRVSMGSLSEAASIFDPQAVEPLIRELAAQALPLAKGPEAELLKGLTAVDGSIFQAVSRTTWALWQDARHRAAKLHLHFSVLEGVPRCATITPAASSETAQLRATLEPDRLYVTDRGYQDYALFRAILDAGSSFIGRVKNNIAYVVQEERVVTPTASAAGVKRDVVLSRLGTSHHKDELRQPVRLVVIATTDDDGKPIEMWLITNRMELDAEVVGLAYRYRWTVELFFRWFKRILGCRHLISTKEKGVTMQLYAALLVSLLIVLWTGLKPNKRTWEMIQHYFSGWASLAELEAHVRRQLDKQTRLQNKKR